MGEPNEQEGKRQLIPKFPAGFILGFMIVTLLFSLCTGTLSPAREPAKQAICRANLHAIGKGIVIYISCSNDVSPPDWATLVQDGHVSPGTLICPSSGTERATTTRPSDVESHCDYIYVSGLNVGTPGSIVFAFELPANHGQKIVNVLYTDIHVECLGDMSKFAGELQRINDYIAEEREAKR